MVKEWVLIVLGAAAATVMTALYVGDTIHQLVSNYRTWANRMQGSRAHQDPYNDLPPKVDEISTSISYLEKSE
jgi:hypothetical protein